MQTGTDGLPEIRKGKKLSQTAGVRYHCTFFNNNQLRLCVGKKKKKIYDEQMAEKREKVWRAKWRKNKLSLLPSAIAPSSFHYPSVNMSACLSAT